MSSPVPNILSEKQVRDLLHDVLDEEELKTLRISSGSNKCEGYCSVMTRVDTKHHQLIIKHAPRSQKLRDIMSIETFYQREIYYYDVIATEFKKLTNSSSSFLVKCYKTSLSKPNELLVFENLRSQGFTLWDRKDLLDETHTEFVLKEYGKFHANSFVMQLKDLGKYNEITKGVYNVLNRKHIGGVYDAFVASSKCVLNLFESGSEIYKKMQEFCDNYEKCFNLKDSKLDRSVVLHGDCWTNNIMFKYENTIPTELRFLDYQIMSIGTPVFDLSQLIYVSCCKKILDNLYHYLKIYYNSLSSNMQTMGCSSEEIYTFEMLKDDWKNFAKFGFSLCMLFMKANLTEEEELRDLNDVAEAGELCDSPFGKEGKNEELANSRIKDVCIHMVENQFI